MIEDIINDILEDNGVMEAQDLLDAVMEYDVNRADAIDAMNRLYDSGAIKAWEDVDGTWVALL